MRYSTAIFGVAAFLACEVVAFPAAAIEYAAKAERDPEAMANIKRYTERYQSQRRAVGFNAAEQYVSNTGKYAFVAPDLSTDARGPCPGLNAMANHNYIPHNGVATIQEFIDGTYAVFGMGKDLGGFLGLYGALVDGDGTKWSIGGPQSTVLIGDGISYSHNKYESDVSPTRPDLYEYGNDYKLIVSQFQQMFALQPDASTANYDLSVLTPFRATRFQQSIENNPYFFNAPFSGVIVQPAAYTFIYRFMGNKSAEYPEGVLNQQVLKSFFSITGESGSFTWREGHEKIPNNWYKRAIGDEYTIPFFLVDLLAAAVQYPQFLDIGGNTGKVNTFTGVNIQNLTGGLLDGATLLEGNNAVCFVFQSLNFAVIESVIGLVEGLLDTLLGELSTDIQSAIKGLDCPTLNKYDPSAFAPFPGAKNIE